MFKEKNIILMARLGIFFLNIYNFFFQNNRNSQGNGLNYLLQKKKKMRGEY